MASEKGWDRIRAAEVPGRRQVQGSRPLVEWGPGWQTIGQLWLCGRRAQDVRAVTTRSTPTVALELSSEFAATIQQTLETGRYADASDVVGEALLDKRDRFAWMRARMAEGLEDHERGDVVPYTPALMELLKREAEDDVRNGVPADDDASW